MTTSKLTEFVDNQSYGDKVQAMKDHAELNKAGVLDQDAVLRRMTKAYLVQIGLTSPEEFNVMWMDKVANEICRQFAMEYLATKGGVDNEQVLPPRSDAPDLSMAGLPAFNRKQEINRTAEMVVDMATNGDIDRAIWFIYDSNRLDAPSMKLLAELVQDKVKGDETRRGVATHLSHCNQGEYVGSCKYGEGETCPALAAVVE